MRALVLLAVLAVATPARAQSTEAEPGTEPPGAKYAGRVISDVRILLEGREAADPVLLDFVETRRGQPLAMSAVRESIAHLFSLGRFEDVQVEASDSADGVELTYNLVPLHAVADVDYEGNLGLSEGLLQRTIRDRYGATPRPGRRADMAYTLQELYRDRGYYRPTIRPIATVRHDPDRTLLTFEIDAGPRARIGDITIEGDIMVPEREFLDRVDITRGGPYERVRVQDRLSSFMNRLRQKGYYEATGTHRATTSPDGLVADLVFEVHPGPAVTVSFEGDPVPGDQLDDLVSIQREGTVDEDLLEDTDRRIADYLHQQGYWKASVTHQRKEEGSALAIVFRIARGLLYRAAGDVEITGNRAIPAEELRPLVRMQAGDVFVASRLDAAITAIGDLYRRRGFAAAKIESAANETDSTRAGEGAIRPAIVITEGPRTLIGEILIVGSARLPETELRPLIRSGPGTPFYAPQIAADRDALLFEYLNRGYASADVNVTVVPSKDGTRADIRFEIREGVQTVVDHVLIVGNTRTRPHVIQRELLLRSGEPLGLQDFSESQRRLSALGLFRRVRITQLAHGSGARRDVLVTVEEAAATTIEYGGGLEGSRLLRATGPGGEAEDRFEVAPRGFFDIGRRNLWGKNRSVNLYTRVSLRPSTAPEDGAGDRSRFGFSEYRVVGTYRQPRLLGPNDATLTAAVEQGVRSSFNFARKGLTAEAFRRLTPSTRATIRYSFGTTRIFDERFTDEDQEDQARIDRIFPQVRLSTFSGAISRDTRDDLADPARGMFLSAEGSVAARSLGGQVGFVKTYLQGFWFRHLPGARRVIFASRVAAGVADGFAREVTIIGPDGNPEQRVIEDLPASERFFAGGDTTIRGFALDSVGAEKTISDTGFPRGGNAVLIVNGELRVPVWRGLATAVFLDGGNVFERVTDFEFGELRSAAGVGVRYMSPIGPVRIDFGFKTDRRQFGGRLESRREIHFSIGHAF
jgi:outer membrane protein assembly complex protein YaeT